MAQNRHWEQDKEATIYVGNIDERATPGMVYEMMLQMGPIYNIHMPRDRVTQNHQGFGFVEFRGPTDAEYAASVMNGIKLYGKALRVNKASADKQKAADVGAELFVGNLDHLVDEKTLYDTFTRFGPLLSLPKVARDESGSSKGFGFVSFADFESSDAAIANLNGQYILSKEVSVQYAFKKDGRGERHGDEAERQLAAQAKLRNIVPESQPIPQAFLRQTASASAAASTVPSAPPLSSSSAPSSLPPSNAAAIPHHQPLAHQPSRIPAPAGFEPPTAALPPGPLAGPPPPGMPPAFAAPHHRPPPAYPNLGHGPVPPLAAAARPPLSLPHPPPPAAALSARLPHGPQPGFPSPADFRPPAFRPPNGSPAPPGFPAAPPPPGFNTPPPGAPGAPPGPPPGFKPPPGFQPPGYPRR